jgi:hypothetical protein
VISFLNGSGSRISGGYVDFWFLGEEMSTILRKFMVMLLFAGTFASYAHSQGGATGAINGTVSDTSGASVAGAEVQIVNAGTEALVRKATTAEDGEFVVTLLPPGIYNVVVNKSGFSEARASGIEVRVTETTRLAITVKAGDVTEKIEISAEVTSVETTNATTGQTLGSQTIRDLPLATQNYQQLLTLSTGAQSDLNAAAQLGRGVVKTFVNGQREDNNNYLIDGISATDYNVAQSYYVPLPNPDVVQEFRVQTSLYDASQGRNSGGNVNAILKSGTKGLHGDVYEFFRNDKLNANEYFLNANGQRRPPVKQNIFGGSLGGPVGTEKFGFFFINYQGTRQRSALSPGTGVSNFSFPALPTQRDAASLAAAFSTEAFAITPDMIDPVVLKLLNAKGNLFGDANGFLIPSVPADPNPNAPYGIGHFVFSRPGKYTDDQFTTNWDREFHGGKDKVGARFFFSDSESYLPFGAGGLQASLGGTLASSISGSDLNFPYDIPVASRFFTISETHLFSTAVVNDFRFGLVHINDSLVNVNPITAADLGIDRPTNNVTKSIYKFTLAGSSGFQIGPTPPADQFQNQNNYNFVETLSWVKSSHIWRFGGDFTRINLDKRFPQVFNGQLFFSDTAGGATDWQNFLIGQPSASFGGGGIFDHKYRANDIGFFAQDDWKVRKNLTLNLGLRLELNGAFKDNSCHIGNVDENLSAQGKYQFIYGGCANGLKVPGLTGAGNNTTYFNNYAKNLAPRFGFAYDFGGKHDTTLRGGYGIYYVREDVGTVDQLSFQAPFLPIAGLPAPAGCLSTFFSPNAPPNCDQFGPGTGNVNALPTGGVLDPNFVPCQSAFLGFTGNDSTQNANYGCAAGSPGLIPSMNLFVLAVPRKFVSPTSQQWNLTVQRDLGRSWVLEIGYVGAHSLHLRETRTNIPARFASVGSQIFAAGDTSQTTPILYNTFANGAARSPVQGINGYSGFQIFASDAYSHYHSLQTTLSRRWGRGYFQGAYTWSKSTDATSTGNTAFNTAFNNEADLKNSRGLSDFDRTHRLAVSYRYELPFFSSAEGWKRAVLGGWEVSGITILQSGTPFSIFDTGAGTAFIGPGLVSTLTASLNPGSTIGSGYTSGDIHQRVVNGYVNINNFVAAPLLYPFDPANPGTTCSSANANFCTTAFGTLGRNTYRGPRQQNWDFSLLKNIRLTEHQNLRFAADFFNIWNHANFANPAQTNVENASSFGVITQTLGTPRLIQLSLRYSF